MSDRTEIDEVVARVLQTQSNHLVRCLENEILVNVAVEKLMSTRGPRRVHTRHTTGTRSRHCIRALQTVAQSW